MSGRECDCPPAWPHLAACPESWLNHEPDVPEPGEPSRGLHDHVVACGRPPKVPPRMTPEQYDRAWQQHGGRPT